MWLEYGQVRCQQNNELIGLSRGWAANSWEQEMDRWFRAASVVMQALHQPGVAKELSLKTKC